MKTEKRKKKLSDTIQETTSGEGIPAEILSTSMWKDSMLKTTSEKKMIKETLPLICKYCGTPDHPHDLIEKGKKFDRVKEQRDEALKILKDLIRQIKYPQASSIDRDGRMIRQPNIDKAEEAIKSTE